ncbi:MAG: Gfo/Idh/MocA family oxidoreductase [Actinobacteria bacterium]|nr:Gfo/Idh/MocA family oxidoreductase [Actinomycetota bacterium]
MASSGPLGVAVVGCGTVSEEYLPNLTSFPDLDVLFCADLVTDRARDQAERFGVGAHGPLEQALAHPGVELVVNLTLPVAHAEVATAAIGAGKHVWNEKPLTTDPATGRALLARAAAAGVRLGCAPDTVLGAGLQTARRLIAQGAIGEPQTALTLMQSPGPESWHPSPEFLFQPGAGPLFDLGPYYFSALATIFGPAARVAAVGRRAAEARVIGSGPKAGTKFPVDVPTHVGALVEYDSGAAASLLFSFDSPLPRHGFVEITGTEATMAVPDPNRFDGDIRIHGRDHTDSWQTIPSAGASAGRGLGVLDLARRVRAGQPPRASGELAGHVLEVMVAVQASLEGAAFEPIDSGFVSPPPLPEEWDPYARTL